jgi:hypothetical protein
MSAKAIHVHLNDIVAISQDRRVLDRLKAFDLLLHCRLLHHFVSCLPCSVICFIPAGHHGSLRRVWCVEKSHAKILFPLSEILIGYDRFGSLSVNLGAPFALQRCTRLQRCNALPPVVPLLPAPKCTFSESKFRCYILQ